MAGQNIKVGEYCNHGVIVPRTFNIIFDSLYDCSPLISLIKGDIEYLSFLHTWAVRGDDTVVDRQVKHWIDVISKKGDVLETVFAPRKVGGLGGDTLYIEAIDYMAAISQRTIVLERNIEEIIGIANTRGVYFRDCGYHLWSS